MSTSKNHVPDVQENESAVNTSPASDGVTGAARTPENDPWRKVKVKLRRDKRSGKGLYVNVNNHNYFIPRGEVVEVPAFVAAVIENSATQDEETARLIESLTESSDF